MESIDEVLHRVARGELSPAEALAALEEAGIGGDERVDTDARWADEDDDDDGPVPWLPGAGPVDEDDVADLPDEGDVADVLEDEADVGDVPDGEAEAEAGARPVDLGKAGEPPAYTSPPEGAPPADDRPRPNRSRRRGPTGTGPGLRVVRLRSLAHAVDVHGDPSVAEIQVVRGRPVIHRSGDAMIVDHPGSTAATGGPGARFTFVGQLPGKISGIDERIVLRVNPELLLDVEGSAVSLRVWGCEGGLRLRISASSVKVERVAGALDVEAFSSALKGSVRLHGRSRIRCESSSVKLGLLPGTDVRISAHNRMGKIAMPGWRSRGGTPTGERTRAVIGAGTGRLSIDATMSSVMLGGWP
jgi:hypothetical protein